MSTSLINTKTNLNVKKGEKVIKSTAFAGFSPSIKYNLDFYYDDKESNYCLRINFVLDDSYFVHKALSQNTHSYLIENKFHENIYLIGNITKNYVH